MKGSLIVLNGPSSVGKTSIAIALQALWPRPLLATGVDTFIVAWPETFTTFPGTDGTPSAPTTGIRLVPGAGPAPSWVPELGDDFHHVMRLAHRAWALIAEGGVDQVIDHVLFDDALRHDALSTLADAFWVGIYCDLDEATRREIRRGDRLTGLASGTAEVAHREMTYDLVIDTTAVSPEDAARTIRDAFMSRPAF